MKKKEDIYTISPFGSGGFAVHLVNEKTYKESVKGKILGVFDTFEEAEDFIDRNKLITSMTEDLKSGKFQRESEEIPF